MGIDNQVGMPFMFGDTALMPSHNEQPMTKTPYRRWLEARIDAVANPTVGVVGAVYPMPQAELCCGDFAHCTRECAPRRREHEAEPKAAIEIWRYWFRHIANQILGFEPKIIDAESVSQAALYIVDQFRFERDQTRLLWEKLNAAIDELDSLKAQQDQAQPPFETGEMNLPCGETVGFSISGKAQPK